MNFELMERCGVSLMLFSIFFRASGMDDKIIVAPLIIGYFIYQLSTKEAWTSQSHGGTQDE